MTQPVSEANAQRRAVATACVSGMSAILFATDPSRWPAFAAFAEQHMGEAWTEQDRDNMRIDARVLNAFADQLDAAAEEGNGNGK